MTAKEKEEMLSRIKRADEIEHDINVVTDCLSALNYPSIEQEIGTAQMGVRIWSAIKTMPEEYRTKIFDVVLEWGKVLNEKYESI